MARFDHLAQKFGVHSVRQAAALGVTCSLWGALVASIAWLAYEGTRPASPALSAAMCPTTLTATTPDTNTDASTTFVPLHERADYVVEPPDVLLVEAGDTHTDGDKYAFSGEKLVNPDGKIDLADFGTLHVAGKTVAAIEGAIEEKLHERSPHARASVSVQSQNSKVFYVIVEGTKDGDCISRFPVAGNETVLDALSAVSDVGDLSKKAIWIARPCASGIDTVLPVNWTWLSEHCYEGVNHPLLPGDRVFVSRKSDWITFVERAAKVTQEQVETANQFPVQPAGFTR